MPAIGLNLKTHHTAIWWTAVLGCLQVGAQEVLLFLVLDHAGHFFCKFVLNSSSSCLRDFVLRMRPPNFIGPLHLFSLDDQFANFGLSVFGWSEWNYKVCSFLTVGFKQPCLRVADELNGRVSSEVGSKLSKGFQMIGQFERHAWCFVQRGSNCDDVVHIWLQRLEDHVELPSAPTAFVDYELCLGLERTEGFKS